MSTYITLAVLLLLTYVVFLAVAINDSFLVQDSLSHWHTTIPDTRLSSEDFYKSVESAVAQRQIPGVKVYRTEFYETHRLSYARPYLCIDRRDLRYYVFAAPMGSSFFVSSWLIADPRRFARLLSRLPVVGWLVGSAIKMSDAPTFYAYDSSLFSQEILHVTLLSVIDEATTAMGAAPLPETVRQPVMRELYTQPAAPQLAL